MTASAVEMNFALGPLLPAACRLTRAPSSRSVSVSASTSDWGMPARWKREARGFGASCFNFCMLGGLVGRGWVSLWEAVVGRDPHRGEHPLCLLRSPTHLNIP